MQKKDVFPSWTKWLESNARKRSVKAALQGTGPELVGSMAACPSTNVLAMKSAEKTGKVKKLPDSTWKKFKEEKSHSPDYSVDDWLKKVKETEEEVKKDIDKAKKDEDNIDKKDKDNKFSSFKDKNKKDKDNKFSSFKDKKDEDNIDEKDKDKKLSSLKDEKDKDFEEEKETIKSNNKDSDSDEENEEKNLLPDNKKEPKLWLKFKNRKQTEKLSS